VECKPAAVPRAVGVVASDGRACGNPWKDMRMNIISRRHDVAAAEDLTDAPDLNVGSADLPSPRSAVLSWLRDDSPYIAMLLLTLAGIVLKLPMGYWMMMVPVFGIVCIVVGWKNFETREGRLQLVYTQGLSWLALVVAIYMLRNDTGVQGVLSESATSLAMMTLLALGTFVAGLQARVWRICAVGGILFLAVPGMGWLDQSAMLLGVATLVVIAIGGLTWWLDQRRHESTV
jgi:hypothetical protein